jgi:membrane protease YdiL (CAAX protease family)
LESGPDFLVLALATVMAVVVAPVAEEITFRLLLQGWLEKQEDRSLGWRTPFEIDRAATETPQAEPPTETPAEFSTPTPAEAVDTLTTPPKRGICGLPYGWAPILVSSFVFAVAHFGYGPEPVPLFVLALILGYCYQRTHRIVPSIVAHALFNLFSMLTLWRLVFITKS